MDIAIPVSDFFRYSGSATTATAQDYLDAGIADDFKGLVFVGDESNQQLLGIAAHGMYLNINDMVSGAFGTVQASDGAKVVYTGQNGVQQEVKINKEPYYSNYLRISSDNSSNVNIGIETATVNADAGFVDYGLISSNVLETVLSWEDITYPVE